MAARKSGIRGYARLGQDSQRCQIFHANSRNQTAADNCKHGHNTAHQTDFLLHRLLQKLADEFIQEGGFSERMTRLRKDKRGY